MILQLDPPLHMQTPKGPGWAHFVIDYGQEHDLLWVVFTDDGGSSWVAPNPQVKLTFNWTMGRRPPVGEER